MMLTLWIIFVVIGAGLLVWSTEPRNPHHK
jgi:hypothetical protein